MYKWAVRRQIRRNIEALGRGDLAPLLRGYADDAVLVFPGASTWGGEHRGKPAIEGFLHRFVAAGLSGRSEDILVNGPPWRTRIAVVFVDRASDADGTEVYANRAVLYAVARAGVGSPGRRTSRTRRRWKRSTAGCTSTASRLHDEGCSVGAQRPGEATVEVAQVDRALPRAREVTEAGREHAALAFGEAPRERVAERRSAARRARRGRARRRAHAAARVRRGADRGTGTPRRASATRRRGARTTGCDGSTHVGGERLRPRMAVEARADERAVVVPAVARVGRGVDGDDGQRAAHARDRGSRARCGALHGVSPIVNSASARRVAEPASGEHAHVVDAMRLEAAASRRPAPLPTAAWSSTPCTPAGPSAYGATWVTNSSESPTRARYCGPGPAARSRLANCAAMSRWLAPAGSTITLTTVPAATARMSAAIASGATQTGATPPARSSVITEARRAPRSVQVAVTGLPGSGSRAAWTNTSSSPGRRSRCSSNVAFNALTAPSSRVAGSPGSSRSSSTGLVQASSSAARATATNRSLEPKW